MRNSPTGVLRLLRNVLKHDQTNVTADSPSSESRRSFVKHLSIATAGTMLSGEFIACNNVPKPTIAIIGAGIAGLTAAYYLERAGLRAELFEASNRVGGRIRSAKHLLADGVITELGGEFIDSQHSQILQFCREFGLPLLDTKAPVETALIRTRYVFGGRSISETEVIQAFIPFAERIRRDTQCLTGTTTLSNIAMQRLDQLSIDAYLQYIGMSGWLSNLISTSFTSEYGLPAGDQSCLNMLMLLNPETAKGFELYGESDERYKVIGGNERIATELHKRLESPVHLGCHLEHLIHKGSDYQLSFANGRQTKADYVVMTLPFSVLREVKLDVEMSARKRRCIQELGYGTISKLLIGVNERIWRRDGYAGIAFSEQIQNGWDSSHMQQGNAGPGGYSLLLGGDDGRNLTLTQFDRYVAGCNQVFPGMEQATSGRKSLYNWSQNSLTRGAYSCYRPGQLSTLRRAEGERVGNILFAGEHCSLQFQGFMNGAAHTGRQAAETIATAVGPLRVRSSRHTQQTA